MVGNLLNILLLITFFAVNGHHKLLSIIGVTITAMPVGNISISPTLGLMALEVFVMAFLLGVMIALPVTASGLLLEFCFGVLMRSVPQMNMFVVGIPMKLVVGFIMLILLMPTFVGFSETVFTQMFEGVEKMFSTFMAAS